MKLKHIRVHQFQQFRAPLDVVDLEDGINLFTGPNESGKSTLVSAIRAAFFERHKSGSLTNLQPWGDSSAAPEVTLEFDWQENRWTLHKRFLQRKRCDLHSSGVQYSGDEADDQLADLLGYEFPGRGASKAEHWGIPGLLWVEQGAGQEIREPVGHAGEHLQSALGQSLGDALGEVASSSGDALITQVESKRGQLLTSTGRHTGDLRDTQQACEALEDELGGLDTRISEYRDQVDRLGEVKRQQQEIDATRSWEAQREKARAAEQQLEAVEKLQQQQEQELQSLETCQNNQQLYRQRLQDFETQAQQLKKRQRDKEQAQQQLDQHHANSQPTKRRLEEAKADYEQSKGTLAAARRHAHRQALQREHDQLAEQVAQLGYTLERARELQGSLHELAERHQVQAVDDKALGRLKSLYKNLETLAIQQQAVATRLGYSLEDEQQLELGEQVLSGEGEQLLLEQTELRIPGVGRLTIKPGGTDVADSLRQQQRQEADRDTLLLQLGAADLAAVEQRAKLADELAQQVKQDRARLEDLAPKGVDELAGQHRLAEQRRDQLAAELEQMPEVESAAELPSEPQAEAALESADTTLKVVQDAEAKHREALGLAGQALQTAESEWLKLHDELHSHDRQQREQEARDELTNHMAKEEVIKASLAQRQRQIDAANPELLAQDVERFTRAAEAMQKHAQAREDEVKRLQVTLETLGAQGLEEQREEKHQELERLQRRRDELSRRAVALDLLLTLLKEQRQAVTRRLQAPLQKHLNHYLKLLFPGAELSVDENLKPDTLIRGPSGREERGDLEALSFGAREQMGLISRLAYADLLQDAGRPTLIILDDALVHCDQARREQMKRILYDAAQRHQILLFTCHPENWQDLGVAPREMQALKTESQSAIPQPVES